MRADPRKAGMHAYTALQLFDVCALLVCATTILARDPVDRGTPPRTRSSRCGW